MKNDARSDYLTRESILKLLSDDEIASVSTAESAAALDDGDEYLDLKNLGAGVRRANAATAMGSVLPKKAIHEDTWNKLLTELGPGAPETPRTYA